MLDRLAHDSADEPAQRVTRAISWEDAPVVAVDDRRRRQRAKDGPAEVQLDVVPDEADRTHRCTRELLNFTDGAHGRTPISIVSPRSWSAQRHLHCWAIARIE